MNNIKKWISDNLFTSGRLNTRRVEKNGKWIHVHFPEKFNIIMDNTLFLPENSSFGERVYCIMNNISSRVLCENCKTVPVNFQIYSRGYLQFCSIKCGTGSTQAIEKRKETKKKHFGDENYNNREKHNQTCLKKYGVKHHWMLKNVKDKRKENWLKKYGVENPSQNDIIEEKKKNTCRENYGVDKPAQCKDIRDKMSATCVDRYGVGNIFQADIFQQLAKQTKLEKYGDENYNNREASLLKVRENFRCNILPIAEANVASNGFEILKNEAIKCSDTITLSCNKGHVFYKKIYALTSGEATCPRCNMGSSSYEKEILKWLESNGIYNIITNNRSIIEPYELDIYLPDYNFAIEFDGIYWHSEENGKDKKYHLNKTRMCEEKNIHLIHVFENEWINNKDIVKSIILSKLGIFKRKYFARKCYVKEIDTNFKNKFLNDNHLQFTDRSSVRLGLFYSNELLSVMTFGKRKITGAESKFELIRFCNKLNTQIVGGASKLFKYFLRNYNYSEVVTYADRRYSSGNLYDKIGFTLSHISDPNYFYFKLPDTQLQNRIRFQKHKLHYTLDNFDSDLTEYENMILNGYNRIWDCGNYVYTFNKQ